MKSLFSNRLRLRVATALALTLAMLPLGSLTNQAEAKTYKRVYRRTVVTHRTTRRTWRPATSWHHKKVWTRTTHYKRVRHYSHH
jgi:hypothetical protein